MGRPKLERNGEGESREASKEIQDAQDINVGENSVDKTPVTLVPTSPELKTKSPVKWVVFRSEDKELSLYQKAGFTDKSHGIAMYTPSTGIKFENYYCRFENNPQNDNAIKWMRNHPSYGISFREVPDLSSVVELPPIAQLKEMTIDELKEICVKNVVTVKAEDSKESIILALVEKG